MTGRPRKHPPEPPKTDNVLPCDGTVRDYRRHSKRGETPCAESRKAWAEYVRFRRYTGIYPPLDGEDRDPRKMHPFFYRKPKRQYRNRGGRPDLGGK